MLTFETKYLQQKKDEFMSIAASLNEAGRQLFSGEMPMTGWTDLPVTRPDELTRIEREALRLRSVGDTLVVIGIGGSYAGTYACDKMLCAGNAPLRLRYAGWNLDAAYHRALLEELDGCSPALCVISKSGSTMETAMAFDLLRDYVEKRCGASAAPSRIVVIAGEGKSPLRTFAEEKGCSLFTLPDGVGGRYSVLSAVGLLPLAAAGCDVRAMLAGAAAVRAELKKRPLSETDCGRYAAMRNLLYREGKRLEVFTLTEERMSVLGQWLAQLFGESEGKNGLGLFPTAAHYSTDLHSLGQFLEDGSRVFFETMLTVKQHRGDDLTVPGRAHTYHESLDAVAEAVWRVRNAKHTPIGRFTLDMLTAESVGGMLYFFEAACAASCLLMGVNPFDQPGVEAYKKELRALLTEPV